ncbi:MAG: Ig-like domain-containing protein [Tepidisphaeraceae bacterium]
MASDLPTVTGNSITLADAPETNLASDPLGQIPTYTTNAAGLPLLTQRASGLKVFLDFDGYNTDTPFDLDGVPSTFNLQEQTYIYKTWRDIVSFFSAFDVNVTTVQPPTGDPNPKFVWQRISNSISGGAAYVGAINNYSSMGWTGSDNAVSRHSGIAHEIGHQLGLSHQAEYNVYGDKTYEYSDGFNDRDRPLMGVDFAENVRHMFYGRNSDGSDRLDDEITKVANNIKGWLGSGDGFKPDDYGNSIGAAATIASSGLMEGVIERAADADVFKLVSVGGTYHIDATPIYESPVAPKLELLDASGNILAARDDADRRNGPNNDQEFDVNLPAGTYYVRVTSSGDYAEQGEYELTAAPLPGGFISVDIGNPFRGGSASYEPSTNTLTQFGAGNDIWNAADQFRFTGNILNGDGSVTAKLESFDNTDTWAKAAVMIRQSLAAGSAIVQFAMRPDFQGQMLQRASTNASATEVSFNSSTAPWMRLTRVGNTFTAYRSTDGNTWTSVGTTTVAMGTQVYIGLATCSHNTREAAWSTMSNIAFTGNLGATPASTNALAAPSSVTATPATGASTGIVLNWTDVAGENGYSIERSVDGVTYAQIGTTAANVLTYTDAGLFGSMRYFYRVVSLDASNTKSVPSAPVSTVNKPQAPTIPDSSYAVPAILPNATTAYLNWADVQGDEGYKVERSTDGGATFTQVAATPKNATGVNLTGLTAATAYVFRITPLTSVGDTVAPSLLMNVTTRLVAPASLIFTAKNSNSMSLQWSDLAGETGYRIERSTDGTNWSTAADVAVNVTTWTDTTVTPVNEYYYRVSGLNGTLQGTRSNVVFAASPPVTPNLPALFSNADIGTVGGSGTSSYSGGTWTMYGSGNDIFDNADAFQFASRPLWGDGSIVVRVSSIEDTSIYSKAGVMIRESSAANSRYAFVHLTSGVGYQFEARNTTGGGAFGVQYNSAGKGPVWVKLTRAGNVFSGFTSADGNTWTALGTTTITMASNVLVGLAVTSHDNSRLAKAVFDNSTVVGPGSGDTTPPAAPIFTSITTDTGTSSTDRITSDNTLILSGTAEASSTVTITRVGTGVIGTVTANASGAWSYDYTGTTLADGTYTFTATAADAAGNVSAGSANFVVVVDRTAAAPTFTGISDDTGSSSSDRTTSDNTLILRGTAEPGATVSITKFGSGAIGTAIADGSGNWSFDYTGTSLAEGNHSFVGTSTDVAGNASTFSSTFTVSIDRTAPLATGLFAYQTGQWLTLSPMSPDSFANCTLSNVEVRDSANALVTSTLSSLGSVTFAALLADGNYHVTGQATDAAGNVGAFSTDFFVLAGDANRDHTVDFTDLLAIAANYGQSSKNFSQGDFNYDGTVNFSDLLILASRYGTTLTSVASGAASVTVDEPEATPTRTADDVLA